MDKETIQQIAVEVIARLPFGDRYWLFLLVNVILMALVGALAALGTSYLRTRGQNLATKHDFDELQKQLRVNTELVETIKSEVSQRDWTQREWTTLRRIKLEAVLEKTHECEVYLDRLRDSAVEGKLKPPERNSINELDVVTALYFPELKSEVYRFVRICHQHTSLMARLAQAMHSADLANDPKARQTASEQFLSQWNFGDLREAQKAVTEAARSLLTRIMNVDEATVARDDAFELPEAHDERQV